MVKVQAGLDDLIGKLEDLKKNGPERVQKAAQYQALIITEQAKELCRVDFAEGGATEQGLQPYTQTDEDGNLQTGVYTNNELTLYHEMGTGPVGTEAGYPGEADMDSPIVRVTDGWTYYSEEPVTVLKNRDAPELGTTESNYIYTEGQPPRAFMHEAVVLLKDQCGKEILAAYMEGYDD